MSSRFLFQIASRMSKSTGLLGARASAHITRRASEDGARNLTIFSHGPAAYPITVVPDNPGVHVYHVRYLSTLHCSPAVTSSMKPALVDYFGAKRIFSSSPSARNVEHKLSAREVEREAKLEGLRAAYKADLADWNAKKDADAASFARFIAIIGSSWCLILLCWISLESGSSHDGTTSCEDQSSFALLLKLQVSNRLFKIQLLNEADMELRQHVG